MNVINIMLGITAVNGIPEAIVSGSSSLLSSWPCTAPA